MGEILIVTGTGTGVGKTATVAAIAATAVRGGHSVAVLKPAQTGVVGDEPGDVAEVRRLAGEVTGVELARYPDPLAPGTAARRAGCEPVPVTAVVARARALADQHDLVLVEGAGGLLVRFERHGGTLLDVAEAVGAPVLLVSNAGLGVLNAAALTVAALAARDVRCVGTVLGSWPEVPDLACRCNIADLPEVTGAPLLGALPAGCTGRADFAALAGQALGPELGGTWSAGGFAHRWAP